MSASGSSDQPHLSRIEQTSQQPQPQAKGASAQQVSDYVELNTQIEILTRVNEYYQTLQAEQISKTRTTTQAAQASSQTSTLEATHQSIQLEVNDLQALVSYLQKNLSPSASTTKILDGYQSDLQTISANLALSPPVFTDQNVQTLSDIIGKVNELSSQLQPESKTGYWTVEGEMFSELKANYQNQISTIENAQKIVSTHQAISYINDQVDKAQIGYRSSSPGVVYATGTPAPSDASYPYLKPEFETSEFFVQVATLYNNIYQMTPTEQSQYTNRLNELLGPFAGLSPEQETLVANAQIYLAMTNYMQANPDATKQDVIQALQKQFPVSMSQLPGGSNLQTALQSLDQNFSSFATLQDGKLQMIPSSTFFQNYSGDVSFNLEMFSTNKITIPTLYSSAQVTSAAQVLSDPYSLTTLFSIVNGLTSATTFSLNQLQAIISEVSAQIQEDKQSAPTAVLLKLNNYYQEILNQQAVALAQSPELGDSAAFQQLQKGISTEVDSLKSLVSILQQHLPENSTSEHLLSEYQTQLSTLSNTLSQTPPDLANENLLPLNQMIININGLSTKLSPQNRYNFWQTEESMFKGLVTSLTGQTTAVQNENSILTSQQSIDQFNQTIGVVNENGQENVDASFFSNLLNLYNQMPNLTDSQSQSVASLLNSISNWVFYRDNGDQSFSIGNYVAYDWVYQQMQTYLTEHPDATQVEVLQAIKSNAQTSQPSIIQTKIQQVLANFSTFFPRFAKVTDGKIEMISPSEFYANFTGFLTSEGTLSTMTSPFTSQELTDANLIVQEYQGTNQFAALQTSLLSAANLCKNESIDALDKISLQQRFAMIVLEKYMPLQQAKLMEKANELSWSNEQATIYNDLLGSTKDFANATAQFTFSNMLKQPSTVTSDLLAYWHAATYKQISYPGSVSGAKQALSNEKKAVAGDLSGANSAVKSINTYLEQLGYPNGDYNPNAPLNKNAPLVIKYKLTLSQVQPLAANLATQKTALTQAISNMTNLQNTLNQIHIISTWDYTGLGGIESAFPTKPGVQPGVFSIAWGDNSQTPPQNLSEATTQGDQNVAASKQYPSELSSQESDVVNGAKNQSDSALGNINQNFTTQSQNASSQSQTAQMQLQMTMTEVQQEWTIVSTSLQLLNQMYMTVAQSIYSL